MQGDYFCFLDADDVLTKESIGSRLKMFSNNASLSFVDGVVTYVNDELVPFDRQHKPSYKGKPLDCLIALDQSCLFGNSWMIRRKEDIIYQFDEKMTHAEDLYFYISVCRQDLGLYDYVEDEILYYRQTDSNSMKNFNGLEDGYRKLLDRVRDHKIGTWSQRVYLRFRITRIMVLTHLFDGGDFVSSLRCCFKYWS
jgi:glycosyltransferase involved in cell wall biosynthesis